MIPGAPSAIPGSASAIPGGGHRIYQASLPALVSQALIIPQAKTTEGTLIEAVTLPWRKILKLIMDDPSSMYEINSRKWEEIIAGTYKEEGWDEVYLTPRSGDYGRDVIAIKLGIGSVRFIESVKRFGFGRRVDADCVRALMGVLAADHNASKGIISTTSEFAPGIERDPLIKPFIPHRIELIDRKKLITRFDNCLKSNK